MPKIITYEELTEALRNASIIGSNDAVANFVYTYEGTIEKIQLIFKDEESTKLIRIFQVYHCNNCNTDIQEPGILVNPSCRNCASTNIEHVGEHSITI
jgi:hypothetical protein